MIEKGRPRALQAALGPTPETVINSSKNSFSISFANPINTGIDLAWCRVNLIHLYGVPAADRFLQAYQALAGSSFEYHPFWDLIVLIEGLPGPPEVYPPWVEFGIDHITSALMQERSDQFLVSIMNRL